MNRRIAIIGTGFLGMNIRNRVWSRCKNLVLTHHKHQLYGDSQAYNFFKNDVGQLLGFAEVEVVIFTAKVEFVDYQAKLEKAMRKFLTKCGGKRVVYISSDGIFDGRQGLYTEDDIPSPVTTYGKNLLLCESLVQEMMENYCIIRPSYLYGNLDSRIRQVGESLRKGECVEKFTDMFKSPLGYFQAAKAVSKLALGTQQGIVHISGSRMSVYQFFKEVMEARKVPTEKLIGVPMPNIRPVDFLPDTSLNYQLMTRLTGLVPASIKKSLR